MKKTKISFFAAIFVVMAATLVANAYAEIYKHVDPDGRITYSNAPMKGAKRLYLDPPLSPSAKARVATPDNFPKVDSRAQKERDLGRRKILEDELAAEEKLLAEAGQALKEGEENPEVFKVNRTITDKDGKSSVITETRRNVAKYDEKIKKLKEQVTLHEKNIVALKKELASVVSLK